MTVENFITICSGGIKFDLSAVLYTNILYLMMMVLPFRFRYNDKYQKTAKWIFIVTNAIAILMNCIDMIYFKFTNRRTTMSVFSEFSHENNMTKIFSESIIQYWYVTIFGLACFFLLYKLYYRPKFALTENKKNYLKYYIKNTIAFLLIVMFTIFGMRGGIGSFVRPITLSNANKYVNKSIESAIVLNTPFCMYRTIGKHPYKDPHYFKTPQALNAIYQPIITPHPTEKFKNLNVVVFIMESFSKEFVGELNKDLDHGKYKGFTPFLDSLITQSLTYEYTFSTGRKSIDAMPSVLSSIPMFYEPYFLTSYSNNKVSGIAGELDKKGYYTAFFHGAPNGSMGFQAFAKISGFKDYYGMNEYNNNADYDGTWAIWDEEFFQFYAHKMSTFKQPFMTALFSASSHHPFKIPERYSKRFLENGHPIHKCIEYSDNALRQFFKTASKQPWFKNTLFVLTADHTNALTRAEYLTDAGNYKVPIIFYQPGSNLKGRVKQIAAQVDIMPSILGYLNYDKPYVAFGHNLFDTINYKNHYTVNFNNQLFQCFEGNYMLQFDGQKTTAVYDFVHDIYLKKNLKGTIPSKTQSEMELKTKAIVQQYVERMLKNNLTISKNN
jgi:phosphoglycerol transferase MdoB-like AlkP superfamily enzyme